MDVSQAYILGETQDALELRMKELTPPQRTSEDDRRRFFMEGQFPDGWSMPEMDIVEYFVPDSYQESYREIKLGHYSAPRSVADRYQSCINQGYEKTFQGMVHPEYGQMDLTVPGDPRPYVAAAREALSRQDIPVQRVFERGDERFLMWEMMRSPDMDSSEPIITPIVLILPDCVADLQVGEIKSRRLPPTAETFAYHQIFIMLERLYAEWPNQEELLHEISMSFLALRELEAKRIPRAFCLVGALSA